MKHTTLAAITTLVLPTLALAATASDTDGDGVLSLQEILVAHPELSEADFASMDANGDGVLDTDEIAVAREAGILPVSDG